MALKHQIVIIGGGNAGISVAAQLLKKERNLDIAIIEPSEKHYYQPAWTMVGGGFYDIKDTERTEAELMPKGVNWIKEAVVSFQPDENKITLKNRIQVAYDYLIVAPGIQLNWSEIKGLAENIGKNGVCSNYSFSTAPYTFECLKNSKSGRALFTSPHTPIKCGGAPQKIMYIAADYFKRNNLSDKIQVEYWSGGTKLFGVKKFEDALKKVIAKFYIKENYYYKLIEIDGANKRAKFIGFGEQNKDVEIWIDYEMIHVTPPQSAPDFVKNSPLANAAGWVDVDKHSLQHVKYPNIFSLGDASSLPTGKTGAAIRKQAPVLVQNLLSLKKNNAVSATYNGYSSCPLITGRGKLILAEFDYDNNPQETFPFNQAKERWSMFILKRYILPFLYWTQILKGKM
ncbi:MAG: FAD-dependent oxidoreductase [Sediminibacterium sp.]